MNDLTLTKLFETQVAKTPDHIAIECQGVTLTYQQLNEKANELAKGLLEPYEPEIKPQTIIGLYIEQSIDYVVTVLGVQKAGCVCVWLDSNLRGKSLQETIAATKCEIIIVNDFCLNHDITFFQSLVSLDYLQNVGLKSDLSLVSDPAGSDFAFQITTSGTTGTPKRVALTHNGLATMVVEQIKIFGLNDSDRVLQWSGLGYDSSLAETFTCLCAGATLVIVTQDYVGPGYSLPLVFKRYKISVVTVHPMELTAFQGGEVSSLRILIFAGEILHRDQVFRFLKFVKCFNAYGLTETSVCATCYPLDPEKIYTEIIPVGMPIAHINIYVVDESMNEVENGLEGEICISGFGSNIYCDNLAADAPVKFIIHPFEDSGLLFCSGDRGYKDNDGNVVILDRINKGACQIDIYDVPEHIKYKRDYLLSFLREEGYRPTIIIDTGSISLLHEGQQYFISFAVDDEQYYQVVKSSIWSLETVGEQQMAFQVANAVNGECQLSKVFLTNNRDNVVVAMESFQPTVESFCHCFHRVFERFDRSATHFIVKMTELINQEKANVQ